MNKISFAEWDIYFQKMMRSCAYLLLLFIFCFQGCINGKSRKDHKRTSKVCDNLYIETFCTFGQGAWGGDRNAEWLTDSTSFRIFLGEVDEGYGKIIIKCINDAVFVTQFPDDLYVNKHLKNPTTKIYQLETLKKMNNLNDL